MSGQEGKPLSRGDFLRSVAAGTAAFIASVLGIPSLAFLISPAVASEDGGTTEIPVGLLEDFPIGVPTRVEYTRTKVYGWERTSTNYGMYVVRLDERNVRVFSDICTHLACRVTWQPKLGHYVSPCHDGHFDLLGGNVSGPPPRPLDEYSVRVEDGQMFATLPPFKRST